MKTMTVAQLEKACERHEYLMLRYIDGDESALNTGVAWLSGARRRIKGKNRQTCIVSVRPCDFSEYISRKRGFC